MLETPDRKHSDAIVALGGDRQTSNFDPNRCIAHGDVEYDEKIVQGASISGPDCPVKRDMQPC